MAALSQADKTRVFRRIMRELAARRLYLGLTKPQLLEVVDAMDTILNSPTTLSTLNGAIPQPSRSILTTPQKLYIYALVLSAQAGMEV